MRDVFLVTDIDRGGAFAHLYGTWKLLEKSRDQKRIRGFVLNKFRGDAALLAPGPQKLKKLTGYSDGRHLADVARSMACQKKTGFSTLANADSKITKTVAIIAYPRISNLDEFQPLKNLPNVRLKWVRDPSALKDADWVLPGSKHTSGDLRGYG